MANHVPVFLQAIKSSGADKFWLDRIMEAVNSTTPSSMEITQAVVPKNFPDKPATWTRSDGKKFKLELKGDRWIGQPIKGAAMENWTFMKQGRWTVLAGFELPMLGQDIENQHIRFHVYRPSVQVYDLTNAGKRGAQVESFYVDGIDMVRDPALQQTLTDWAKKLPKMNYAAALSSVERILNDARGAIQEGYIPTVTRFKKKGVEVAPAGFKPFKLDTPFVEIEAGHDSFHIYDKVDQNNLPACIPSIKGTKTSVKLFYRWVQDNLDRIKKMRFQEITQAIGSAGIPSHQYCRMD